MERYYYGKTTTAFLEDSPETVFGALCKSELFDTTQAQKGAWQEEIVLLREVLSKFLCGDVFFEFVIPRLGKRVDVVLLLGGVVFCLEFKVGASTYALADREQVWDYALDLKNFHEPSRDVFLVPVLVATEAPPISLDEQSIQTCHYDRRVYAPVLANRDTLGLVLHQLLARLPAQPVLNGKAWAHGRYAPTPTIIQAASALYAHHRVEAMTRCEAGENLQQTTAFILNVIERAKARKEKCVCFVTGVPGAGKTLIGLNVAMKQFEKKEPAVYLSGNGPLVDVLSEALARDHVRQKREIGQRCTLTAARREVKSFIQMIHHYRDNALAKLKTPFNGALLEVDPAKAAKHAQDGYSDVEHVAIFDEAQRLWDQPHLAAWLKRKKHLPNFPMSESEFLIWSLDLRPDWAVVVCLVGEGQEINTGEAGIGEPLRAMCARFPNWQIYLSPQLKVPNRVGGEDVAAYLHNNPQVRNVPVLHLATSMRSFRAEKLADFVSLLLDRDVAAAQQTYASFCAHYPIVLTRSLPKAKAWLRQMAGGSERYGLVCSSQAARLRPLAIDVRAKPDVVHWFLDDITDIRSSQFLEDVATEFDIQGLEVDWACLIWDGDFRYTPEAWKPCIFSGGRWKSTRDSARKQFQLNAYRVLLTRARKGMVICVPEGDKGDPPDVTRSAGVYDGTFRYLQSLGLKEL